MENIIAKLLQDFAQGRISRRQLIKGLAGMAAASSALNAPTAAAAGNGYKATSINHISYQVKDYAKTRDFYASLFGMKVTEDNGKQCRLVFGDSILLPRSRPSGTPKIDHIAYTIANWDAEKEASKQN